MSLNHLRVCSPNVTSLQTKSTCLDNCSLVALLDKKVSVVGDLGSYPDASHSVDVIGES